MSRFLKVRASIVLVPSGMVMVCCAPRTMAVRARRMPAYQKAGPDQWLLGMIDHERHDMIDANSTAP